MAQYSKVQLINQLQKSGLTAFLYSVNLVSSQAVGHANIYNHLSALVTTGRPRKEAIKLTAAKFRTTRRTIYNIIKSMETSVEVPKNVEKLLSKGL